MSYLPLSDPEVAKAANAFLPTPEMVAKAHVKSLEEYKGLWEKSLSNPEEFWGEIASQFHWEKKWATPITSHNYSIKAGKVDIKWFEGGKTNICYNCLDRNIDNGHGDRIAFYWEGNEVGQESTITYSQLLVRVQKFSHVLRGMGVKKGDNVAIYMPMILELVVAMLACARIGAPHSIVFGGFSAEALADRVIDCKSAVIVTSDGVFRGKKFIDLKQITDDACEKTKARGFEVSKVIVARNLKEDAAVPWTAGRDVWFADVEAAASSEDIIEWVDAEDPLFLLYTSGSTGRPKGVVHSTGGYMVWTATTLKYTFDYHMEDVYWCTADIGWITGHSYITYGPLLNCATSVMFEGVPTYPDPGRFWEVVQKYKVAQFYTAPTAIRALQRHGDEYPKKYDMSSLRVLGTVGEPINPEAWHWYFNVIGDKKCPVVDTWWQTETGGHMLTALPGATPTKPGAASLPMFGVVPAVVDGDGKELDGPCQGYLVIKQPWPGQMRTVYGDHDRFEVTYFSAFDGYYCTGDGCRRDEHGYYWITGRTDDVINVSGHRIGTAELESAMARSDDVVEAAIVAVPHAIKGEAIYAYAILRQGLEFSPEVEKSLKQQIRNEIGAFATPEVVQGVSGLPKTRSGKIMRRILRKIATREEEQLGDVSTLADPTVIQELLDTRPPPKK